MSAAAPAYRPDVDGLRALAVLGVLAYHAFPGVLPGGFAGVDVFFVISGYLISQIILKDLEAGRFSVARFYARRIRRIFPALIVVLAATLLIGWRILLPDEFAALGKHVAAGAGFVSNLALWREAGYFDPAAELKPLLHLWSLGIEEQFYLVWPLLLWLLHARGRALAWTLLGIAAASFVLNVATVGSHPQAAFYSPFTRLWELAAGSLLALLAMRGVSISPRLANPAAWAGLLLLATGYLLLNQGRAFPGWWALLPVGGTLLLIAAGATAWVNSRLLATRWLVFIGLISYPLYLWHWPLLAFARIAEDGEPPVLQRAALLALAALLAWLTYELVEKPIRFGQLRGRLRAGVMAPALAAGLGALAIYGVLALRGAAEPQSAAVAELREISRAALEWEYPGDRVVRGDTEQAVLFFGDSHAQHYWPRIDKLTREHAAPLRTVIFRTASGCAPVPGIERGSRGCSRFVDEGLALAASPRVEVVVIAASWVGMVDRRDYVRAGTRGGQPLKMLAPEESWVLEGFEAALHELVREGKRVVVVLSSPRGAALDPKGAVERGWFGVRARPAAPIRRQALEALTAPIDDRLRAIAARAGAAVLDPADWLCERDRCPAADPAGRPLYKDESHLRASVARERVRALDAYVYSDYARGPNGISPPTAQP